MTPQGQHEPQGPRTAQRPQPQPLGVCERNGRRFSTGADYDAARAWLEAADNPHTLDDAGESVRWMAFTLLAFMVCVVTLAAWALYLTSRPL